MGIADFGVGVDDEPYRYETTAFLGNFSWQGLNFRATSGAPSSDTNISIQLNAVLVFTVGDQNYSYWVQDVAFVNTATLEVFFEDNVWNLTTSAECLADSAVSGNGTVLIFEHDSCVGYYAYNAEYQAGNDRIMGEPGSFSLLLRSYGAADGAPEVSVGYWDGATTDFVTYDNVQWPWATDASDDNFVVDGEQYTPANIFYDAELVVAGPGDASSSEAFSPTNVSTGLFLWNGHNFQAPRAVWNFGSDTAETSSDLVSGWTPIYSVGRGGTPVTVQQYGTGPALQLGEAYNQSEVGALNLSAAGVTSGTVAVGPTDWNFQGGQANLTLDPGSYTVWVNSSGGSDDLGSCDIAPGVTTYVVLGTGCSATVSEPEASPSSVDFGQNVSFTTTLESAGSGSDSYSWNVSPSGLGCGSSTGVELNCSPTAPGVYNVSVTVRDSEGTIMTSPTLRFAIHPDPTLSLAASRTEVDVGQETILNAAPLGGTGVFRYLWGGLPAGCTGGSGPTIDCFPTLSAVAQIEVNATDSAGLWARASLEVTVYPAPSAPIVTVSPAAVLQGSTATIEVDIGGGRAPYLYGYTGLPSGCLNVDTPELNCTPTAAGTFGVVVQVTDADGVSVNSTVELTVTPVFLGLPAAEGYAVLALGVAVAVAVAVVVAAALVRRHPRSSVHPPPPAGPSSSRGDAGSGLAAGPTCWGCGSSMPPGALYCGGCGRPLAPPSGPDRFGAR
jgi:thermopsin